jgi:hypothetical protein
MSHARYTQPLESHNRDVGEQGVLYAGFTPDGEVGFILRARGKKEIRTEATRENQANERPRGFFASLARMFGGRP